MKKRFHINNNGSTLLLVIIAMCFIGILGSLILSLTMTNIQMKQIDYQAKENFYQSETVLNELNTGLEQISSDCMYKAYNYLLLHYAQITQDTNKSLKSEFDMRYIKELVRALCGVNYDPTLGSTYTYQPSVLKNCLISTAVTDRDRVILNNDSNTSINVLKVNLDTTKVENINSVVLQNVKIKYKDSHGFETTITTDINLESPNLNFDSASIYPEFTKYALIANEKLLAQGGKGMLIEGNVYAGPGGVTVDASNIADPDINNGYNLKVIGDTLITRGDVTVNNFAKLFLGDNTNKINIWAENIATVGNASGSEPAYININGNCKVADDLTLGAKRSEVIINGTYNGYNFNYDNTTVADSDVKNVVNSNYSSAILINGINSSLDMSGVTSLSVAGRAFVSRKNQISGGSVADDIMTGESISVKSNQSAYLVPNEYIWCGHNPVMKTEITAKPVDKLEVTIPDISGSISDLLTSRKYVEYHYLMNGIEIVYYYLEFKNQACANRYFKDYYSISENKSNLDANANTYLSANGIKLSGALLLAANGLMTKSDGSLELSGGVLSNPDFPDASLLMDAKRTAKEYKSRQLSLVPSSSAANSGSPRLNKTDSPLFHTIISQYDNNTPADLSDDISVIEKEAAAAVATSNGFVKHNNNYYKRIPIDLNKDNRIDQLDYCVYIVKNDSEISTLDISNVFGAIQNGIIVSTGDLNVVDDYEGLIIADGTVKMLDNNVMITSNPNLVQDILSYALEKEKTNTSDPIPGWKNDSTKKFTHYFTDYSDEQLEQENIDQVDISKYITYENWKKNAE